MNTAPPRLPWGVWLWAALALAILAGWLVVTRLSVTRELPIWIR